MNPPNPDPNFPPRPPEPGPVPPGYYPAPVPPGDGLPMRFGLNGRPFGGRPGPNGPSWRYGLVGVFLGAFGLLPGRLPRPTRLAAARATAAASRPGAAKTFVPFWEAWNHVHQDYVDQSAVNDEKMERAAIAGMLIPLHDEGHTVYLDPEQAKAEHENLQGSLEGIGASISVRK